MHEYQKLKVFQVIDSDSCQVETRKRASKAAICPIDKRDNQEKPGLEQSKQQVQTTQKLKDWSFSLFHQLSLFKYRSGEDWTTQTEKQRCQERSSAFHK